VPAFRASMDMTQIKTFENDLVQRNQNPAFLQDHLFLGRKNSLSMIDSDEEEPENPEKFEHIPS